MPLGAGCRRTRCQRRHHARWDGPQPIRRPAGGRWTPTFRSRAPKRRPDRSCDPRGRLHQPDPHRHPSSRRSGAPTTCHGHTPPRRDQVRPARTSDRWTNRLGRRRPSHDPACPNDRASRLYGSCPARRRPTRGRSCRDVRTNRQWTSCRGRQQERPPVSTSCHGRRRCRRAGAHVSTRYRAGRRRTRGRPGVDVRGSRGRRARIGSRWHRTVRSPAGPSGARDPSRRGGRGGCRRPAGSRGCAGFRRRGLSAGARTDRCCSPGPSLSGCKAAETSMGTTEVVPIEERCPATSYSPTQSPAQYHRRRKA